jgi:hypothetical protein
MQTGRTGVVRCDLVVRDSDVAQQVPIPATTCLVGTSPKVAWRAAARVGRAPCSGCRTPLWRDSPNTQGTIGRFLTYDEAVAAARDDVLRW